MRGRSHRLRVLVARVGPGSRCFRCTRPRHHDIDLVRSDRWPALVEVTENSLQTFVGGFFEKLVHARDNPGAVHGLRELVDLLAQRREVELTSRNDDKAAFLFGDDLEAERRTELVEIQAWVDLEQQRDTGLYRQPSRGPFRLTLLPSLQVRVDLTTKLSRVLRAMRGAVEDGVPVLLTAARQLGAATTAQDQRQMWEIARGSHAPLSQRWLAGRKSAMARSRS